jgi:hypothetical protein
MTFTQALKQFDEVVEFLISKGAVKSSYQIIINVLRNSLVRGAGEEQAHKKSK